MRLTRHQHPIIEVQKNLWQITPFVIAQLHFRAVPFGGNQPKPNRRKSGQECPNSCMALEHDHSCPSPILSSPYATHEISAEESTIDSLKITAAVQPVPSSARTIKRVWLPASAYAPADKVICAWFSVLCTRTRP